MNGQLPFTSMFFSRHFFSRQFFIPYKSKLNMAHISWTELKQLPNFIDEPDKSQLTLINVQVPNEPPNQIFKQTAFETFIPYTKLYPNDNNTSLVIRADAYYIVEGHGEDQIEIYVQTWNGTQWVTRFDKYQYWNGTTSGGGTRSSVILPFSCHIPRSDILPDNSGNFLKLIIRNESADDVIEFGGPIYIQLTEVRV
jgi:hypothetical protein